MKLIACLSCFVFLFLCTACTKKQDTPVEQMSSEQLVTRGQSIYKLNCIACHNIDPTKDGVTGPALAGSNLELLTARLLRAEYPAGYKAKRSSNGMPAMKHLEKEIPALEAYLKSVAPL